MHCSVLCCIVIVPWALWVTPNKGGCKFVTVIINMAPDARCVASSPLFPWALASERRRKIHSLIGSCVRAGSGCGGHMGLNQVQWFDTLSV